MMANLYYYSGDKRVINKTLESAGQSTFRLKAEVNLLSPVLIFQFQSGLLEVNYLQIDEFNRSYFVDDMRILDGNRIEIQCSIDVLNTYKDGILAMRATAVRNPEKFNQYLADPRFVSESRRQVQTKIIAGTPFKPADLTEITDCFVLSVAGG